MDPRALESVQVVLSCFRFLALVWRQTRALEVRCGVARWRA